MNIRSTLLLVLGMFPAWMLAQAPCTTTNATGCVCATPGQNNCDLLPDIAISTYGLMNHMGGPTEYSQTGNGVNDGRLRVSGSTPNMGFGPFTVGAVNIWVCNTDTFTNYNTATQFCQYPKQLIKQKIYHKNGNNMTYTERWAGSMTYHPTHGHMHVDDWATFSLRIEDTNDPNPLNWPIVGTGAKVGFCLMDYGTCSGYSGHCRDSSNNVMMNGDFSNWGLGGGSYNCSPVEQGISVGHTDIYSENLDGMWIDIPPGTCNGDYYIVIEVDPNNNFLESDENNNWLAAPFTLTKQVQLGQYQASVALNKSPNLCAGDDITLTASAGNSYLWSNGATTQSITVNQAGSYTCSVTAPCGSDVSAPVVVTISGTAQAPVAQGDAICEGTSATLTVSGTGNFNWFDAPTSGNLVGTGPSFSTPALFANANYYVEKVEDIPGSLHTVGPFDGSIGTGAMHTNNTRYLEFDAVTDFTLKSVWVNAGSAGNRTIELRDDNNTVLQSASAYIPAGASRVTLNFAVTQGTDLRLGLNTGSMTDLYRNNGGVSYPYSVANVAEITGSSAGGQYYYFYYDWEIQEPDMSCSSARTMVTASVTPAPTPTLSGLAPTYAITQPSVTLAGSPSGGTFTGPGVSGSTFSPALAGIGTHIITYTYTDGTGCSGSTTQTVIVTNTVGLNPTLFSMAPSVYPNPHNGRFTLSFSLNESRPVGLRIATITGQVMLEEDLGEVAGLYEQVYDVSEFARGVYFVELTIGEQKIRTKVVYQ